jgi:hypothetical protein
MSYIHSVKIDRKIGKVISCEVTPSDISVNNVPLANYTLGRMEQLGIIPSTDLCRS